MHGSAKVKKSSCEHLMMSLFSVVQQGYAVECIQLTATGLIAGSVGGPVIINPSNGTCEKCTALKDASMTVVTCFKAFGRWIVGASSLSTEIHIWDVHSKTSTTTLKGGSSNVVCLDFVGNPPETIITGNNDGSIGVWDVQSRECIKIMRGHGYMVTSISIIGNFVVSGSIDRTVKVWPIEYGQCMETWEGHSGAVTCLDMFGDLVVTGSYDYTVRVWSLTSSECVRTIDHPDEVLCLKAKGCWIVTACGDKYIRLLDADTGKCIRKILGPSAALSLDFDGYCIVGGFENNTVCMWSIDALTSNFAPPSSPIRCSSQCYLQRLRSLPSGIPRCPSLVRNPSLSGSLSHSSSLPQIPRHNPSHSRVLHSAASDLPDEDSDIFKGDTLSDVSDDSYTNFDLDVAVAIENVFKDEVSLASSILDSRDGSTQAPGPELPLQPESPQTIHAINDVPIREHVKNIAPHMEQNLKVFTTRAPTTSDEETGPFSHPIKLDNHPSRFARIGSTKETLQIGDNVIEPIGVMPEKVEEHDEDKIDGRPTTTGENQIPSSKPKNKKPFSIMKLLLRTMPCLMIGGAWLISIQMHKNK